MSCDYILKHDGVLITPLQSTDALTWLEIVKHCGTHINMDTHPYVCDMSNNPYVQWLVLYGMSVTLCTFSSAFTFLLTKVGAQAGYNYWFIPHNTDIFYCLILPCGVRVDPRPRFTICTYRNDTDCLYLLYISYLTSFTWHIIWTRIRKVPLQHPWATFLSYTKKKKSVWAKWARYSIPHNFLTVCDRKAIFVPLSVFLGSRKMVLTFILQLKKLFFFFNLLQWN